MCVCVGGGGGGERESLVETHHTNSPEQYSRSTAIVCTYLYSRQYNCKIEWTFCLKWLHGSKTVISSPGMHTLNFHQTFVCPTLFLIQNLFLSLKPDTHALYVSILASGGATVWPSRHGENPTSTCCGPSHRVLLHPCVWVGAGAEVHRRRIQDG